MFFLCQRTDTLPEQRALVNSEHVVAILPVAGGVRSKLYLVNSEAWEISLPFTRTVALFREETEVVSGVPPQERGRAMAGAGSEAAPGGMPSLRPQP
jgi:hypothetical protein